MNQPIRYALTDLWTNHLKVVPIACDLDLSLCITFKGFVYFDNVRLGSRSVHEARFARTGTIIEMLNDKRSSV